MIRINKILGAASNVRIGPAEAAAAAVARAEIAYAELLLKVLVLPKTVVTDEDNKRATTDEANARILAKNRVRAELRTLLGEDIFR